MSLIVPFLPVNQVASIEIEGVTYYPPRVSSEGFLQVAVARLVIPVEVGSLQKVVTTAGVRVQLTTQICKAVSIASMYSNTGKIYLGDITVSSGNGRILEPGDSISLMIDNINRLYIDAENNGEGITYLWVW